ncbi:F-box/FBD/LRR-repeat protein At1g16930 [Lactuca sativa]|uniref:F-box domain-containing protein n=1 Tax=Lactuca sativa TaxID=4236 RepID=A0A9R1V2R0_LACSA|nr:F-box/FBD/LRR-repeat protein At1g16930 [Lactuca sativa]KAJ0198496.1 hypothetical protein LSAT_V11C700347250 [Lactuca sativa]
MKESKRAKTLEGELDGVDLISNLPDRVLQLILSRLQGTEEAIRSSILSRRWRYLWTSIPSIDIDYTRGLEHDPQMVLESIGFKNFVSWVLLNKPIDLDSFRLRCADYYDMTTIRQWIHAAVVRKVKQLDLMFSPIDESEDIEMPYCLVTCGSLEVLRLCLLGYHLCLPKITGFSALRVLELNDVTLKKGDLVKYFLESCPLLEDLSLLHCYADKLVIACPKLKNLRIENRERIFDYETEDYIDCRMSSSVTICCPKLVLLNLTGSVSRDFILYNLYSLKKAVILCRDFLNQLDPPCDFFERISQVESLSISLYCVGQAYWPEEDEPVSLPNLKTLEITVDAVHRLIPFLKCFPDLESLHLIFINESSLLDLMEKFFYRADKCKLKNAATINFVTPRLKKVEFHDYDEEHLALARALLENGSALEEMVFIWIDEAKFHEKSLETMNQVSNFHKASSNVKLRFVIKPRQTESILAPKRFEVDSSKCSSNSSIKLLGC